MIALKKIVLTCTVCLSAFLVNAQNVDFGITLDSDSRDKVGLQLRKTLNEKYKLRISTTVGSDNAYLFNNRKIIASTDSSVTFEDFTRIDDYANLYIGAERQLGNSLFSVGGDLKVGYEKNRINYYTLTTTKNSEGDYQSTASTLFADFTNPAGSNIIRHYLVTGLRLSLNLNAPISDSWIFHSALNTQASVPIYMGATQRFGNQDRFIGNPPSVFNLNVSATVGIRYLFGMKG